MRNKKPLIRRLNLACIFFVLMVLAPTIDANAGPDQGKALFASKKCVSCHLTTGPVDAVSIAERQKIKGPPLWFAGSKFKADWLTGWLESPVPIRRVIYGTLEQGSNDHPALTMVDAAEVSAYLMSLKDLEMKTGVITEKKLPRRKMMSAEKLFAKKQVCFGCHTYPSRGGDVGGFTGPSLVGAGQRLQGDWVYMFLNDNTRYFPNGRMPVYGESAFDSYTDDELVLLSVYIGNL